MLPIVLGTVIHTTVKIATGTMIGFWMAGAVCHACDKVQNKIEMIKAKRQVKKTYKYMIQGK